ncbi:MAG: DUF502 domain-containing protein [Planctomycetes bacterium]|nr:DUF502 domain-containing protein [Planctomycetota bacterium]MBL7142826.1 DUF502 domain-containing protein [Phycisphaerae bacterium]
MAGRLKSYFLRGLAVLLPTILTIGIFVWGYQFIQNKISIHINRGLVRLILYFQGNSGITKETLTEILVDGTGSVVGFLVALIAVFIVGALLASVVGKTLWRMIEKFIMNTPVLSKVYPYVKQITDFLFAQEEQEKLPFSRVVAVEYPRKGIWSLGLVTGSGLTKIVDNVRKEFLTVLIPTSPTPFTGFVIMVPKKQTMDMNMTVEEAFRFTVSGGVITPGQKPDMAALPQPETEV